MNERFEVLCNEALIQDGGFGLNANLPINTKIMYKPIPSYFKISQLEAYEGSTNLIDHLKSFRALMFLYGTTNGILY